MREFPKTQDEFEAWMFGPGYCTGCGKDVDKLAMVEMTRVELTDVPAELIGVAETDEDGGYQAIDPSAPRRGLCEPCVVAKYVHNKH